MSLFSDLARGYADSRPPVHPEIIEIARARLPAARFENALDIGCGAGISTRALSPFTARAIGLEPAEAMLEQARRVAPESRFVVGRGEALPFASGSIELMSAAGSLNYAADLSAFFSEARRVLRNQAPLLVYDFSPGRRAAPRGWFERFMARYPPPRDNARFLDAAALRLAAAGRFGMAWHESFQISIALSRDFYIDYMMTETNVAAAIRGGADTAQGIRHWISRSLPFSQPTENILFDGYLACLR